MRDYDKQFYENEQDSSLQSARIVAALVHEWIKPTSVVDVGCGVGGWLKAFQELGATRLHGYDGDWVDPEMLRIPKEDFTPHDISTPIEDDRNYDLAINLEAAEHLPPEKAEVLVASLTKLAPVILFSAAIPFQEGRNHVNENWPDYWIQLFDKHGYVAVDCIRSRIWNNDDVRWWYKQNTMLMVKSDRVESDEVLKRLREEPQDKVLPLVHPELFEEKWAKYQAALKKSQKPPATIGSGFRELRRGLKNSIRRVIGKEPR